MTLLDKPFTVSASTYCSTKKLSEVKYRKSNYENVSLSESCLSKSNWQNISAKSPSIFSQCLGNIFSSCVNGKKNYLCQELQFLLNYSYRRSCWMPKFNMVLIIKN